MSNAFDPIEPDYYKGSGLEPITVIEAWGLNFHLGNCVKYVCRAGKKGDALEDLKKGLWYLQRHIENLERERRSSKEGHTG